MPSTHACLVTPSPRRRNDAASPEPPAKWYERFTLPATAWVTVPVQFIEILIQVCPSSSLPTLLLDHFDQSTSTVSLVTGIIDSIGGLSAFLLSPLFGRWADVYGRKPLLILLSALSFLPITMLSFYPYLNLWFYLSVRALGKLSAFGILFSCVSDVAPSAKDRARLFGQTSGLGMLAMVGGPSLSLLLSSRQSFRVCGGMAMAVMAYLLCLMPETLWIGRRKRMEEEAEESGERDANHVEQGGGEGRTHPEKADPTTLGNDLTQSLLTSSPTPSSSFPSPSLSCGDVVVVTSVVPPSLSFSLPSTQVDIGVDYTAVGHHQAALNHEEEDDEASPPSRPHPCAAIRRAFFSSTSPELRRVALVILFSQLSQNGVMECAALYLKKHLHFSRDDNSLLLLVMGSWAVVVLVALMPLLLRRCREKHVLVFSLVCDLCHQLLYVVIPNKRYVYTIAAAQGLGFVAYPASNAVLSKCVSRREQGAVLAMSAGIRSLTQGVAPLMFNGLLAYFTWHRAFAYFPQAPFCLSAVFTFTAMVLGMRLKPTQHELLVAAASAKGKGGNVDHEVVEGEMEAAAAGGCEPARKPR